MNIKITSWGTLPLTTSKYASDLGLRAVTSEAFNNVHYKYSSIGVYTIEDENKFLLAVIEYGLVWNQV